MRTLRRFVACAIVILFSVTSATAQGNSAAEHHGPDAAKIIPGASYVRDGKSTSFPAFVRFASSANVRAENFSNWLKQTLRVQPTIDFVLYKQHTDNLGMTHYRYRQTYNGVPVDNAAYIAHARSGMIVSFNGYVADVPSTNPLASPALSESDALTKAKTQLGYAKYMWEDPFWENDLKRRKNDQTATHFPKATLCWFIDNGKFTLAYKFDLDIASPTKFERAYVDANTGALLKTLPMQSECSPVQFNHIFEGTQWISTDQFTTNDFRLRDNCQDAVIHIRDWNSLTLTSNPVEIQNTTNTWTTNNERLGGTALWGMEVSTEYYAEAHGRDAYDDNGGDVDGLINALFPCTGTGCTHPNNASMTFSGGHLLVGSGNAGNLSNAWSTLDILGHEYTHAVTGSTAQLKYEGESGALNESFSDIFGEAIESYWNGTPDWLVGNQRAPGAIRDLMNPNNFSQPDTYLGTNWFTISPPCDNAANNDRCGVHTNSGVQNFWFFLLSQGGTGTNDNGDAYVVYGLGLDLASHIAYRNLTEYLGENSDYADARDGAIQSAIDMAGECSWEVEQVTNAWGAVGVGVKYLTVDLTTSNYNGFGTSCHNTCDGSVTAAVSGGTGVYTVEWNTGSTQYTIGNLCQGTYLVTVYEVGGPGCGIITSQAVISPPPPVTAFAAATTVYHSYNISCFGGNDGGADVEASGGTSVYAYQWSNGSNTVDVDNLTAGSYEVTVTDQNNCLVVAAAYLSQPTQLNTTASITSNYNGYNVRCNGGSDGAATTSPTGGVAPYTYQWSGGQTSASPNNLSAGLNTVVVTDANGCTASASVTLTQPPALFVDGGLNKTVYRGYPDSACANLNATGGAGGVPPYSYTWSNGVTGTQQNVCPIASTVYKVTISDANSCSVKDSVRVCVIDVRCGNNLNKVQLCHKDVTGLKTQCIALADVHNHLAHGDRLGACGINRNCTFGTSARADEIEFDGNALVEAFPNPFTNSTTIRFVLPTDSRGVLNVYDVAGREIQTLFNGDIQSGNIYEVTFDASTLSDGLYIYRLITTDGNVFNGKLILTK